LRHWLASIVLAVVIAGMFGRTASAFEVPLLLVTDREANKLHFVNADTYEIIGSIPTGRRPQEIAVTPDNKKAFVSNLLDHRNIITVVDLEELTKLDDLVPTPYYKPHSMAVTRDGKRLYVTTEVTKSITEMSIETGKVLRAFDTNELLSHMLVLSPDEKTIYTTSALNGVVVFIDVESGLRKGSILSGAGCEGIDISPDGSEVWAANRRGDNVTIIDTETKKVIEKVGCTGYPLRVEFTPDGTKVLVSCASANVVNVFDAKSHESIGFARTQQVPVGIAISPDGKRAFTANNGEPSVTVIDLEKLEAIDSFPIGVYPFGIVYVEATQPR
jgi:YVTN family beta-propeller protein